MLSRYRETLRGWSDPVGRTLFHLRLRPNHLTVAGLAVSFVATAAFVVGRTRLGGLLLILAGLCDYFDGSLARASGQVTPFGAFLDSVIDRYSDLLVMLGIVVFFASMAEPAGGRRGALVAMAGLVGSIMVSYTKARAESIGIECNVGFMERPERMICLIAGAVLDVLEPALWVLAVLANITAIHRIAHTRRLARAMTVGVVLAVALGVASAGATEAPARPSDDAIVAWRVAVEQHQRGDSSTLLREFRSDTALKSRIGDYVRWYLADAFSRRGQLTEARLMAASIAEQARDSRLAPAGLLAAATLADRAGDDAGAQKLLTRLIESYPDSAEMPAALYLLGLTGEARGQLDAAAAVYRELQILVPTSGWADGAGDRLAALARGGTRIPELSLAQRLDRAERLLKGGVPQTAVDEAERIVSETKDAPAALRALRIVADAAQRMKKWDVAARALSMAVSRAPNAQKPALLLEQARLTGRGKQPERALPIYATVVATGTEAEAAEAAYQRARILDDVDRDGEAATAYRAVATRYPTREVAGASLWRLGWLAWAGKNTRDAGDSWARLTEIPGGRTYRISALYWAGRARETAGQRREAERLWKRILTEAPRSYYGLLAAHRVAGDASNEAAAARAETPAMSVALPADPAEALADDPGYTRVDLLRRVGLLEDAVAELDVVVHRSLGDTVRLYSLSSAYVRDERYHLALRILRRHFTVLATSGHPSLPQAFWEMLYPFGWRRTVTEAAEREGLDPFLVAALVREESSYYPRAISRAGARGLMQLMPRTAQLVANHGGIALQGVDTLDDPGINVDLGTRFLAGMLKEFRDPRLALAAYNAGPGRVRQWLKARPGDDIEAFVEQIPFDETRGYVKRVMLSWEEYRRVYGAGGPDIAPRTPQRFAGPEVNSGPALLAAVVVNYRTPAETLAAVRSLLASHRPPDRIFVVDNGSGDESLARFGVEPRAVVIQSDRNVGFPAGANLGIRAALASGADAVFLLNSDAAVAPDCVARLARALDADPDAGIAGALVRDRAEPSRVLSAGIDYSQRTGRIRERRRAPASDDAARVDAVSGCAMLVRRQVFDRIGLLAEEYFFSFEDVDFCLRARAAGVRTLVVPAAKVTHEGSRSIGRRSPERLYFAARNHLLLAGRVGPAGAIARRVRDTVIVALNVAHALITSDAPRLAGLASVCRGVADHARGRYGAA